MSEDATCKTSNTQLWDKLRRPPKTALKQIKGGRLSGMTDVNPQWRYQAMTAAFGPCGDGWKYEIVKVWTEQAGDLALSFAHVNLYVRYAEAWSAPIPGIGGSSMIAKEKGGLHVSDECYKMAITDALSVAMKMLGVAADIYAGLWDGSKYRDVDEGKAVTPAQAAAIRQMIQETTTDEGKFLEWAKAGSIEEMDAAKYGPAVKLLESKKGGQ